jgi:hypothetical protein
MKTSNLLNKTLVVPLAVIFVMTMWLTSTVRAADQMKGAELLLHLNPLKTVGEVETLKTGDTVAMACAKCKTIFVAKVVSTAKGAEILAANGKPTQLVGIHPCTGCKSTMEVVGQGRAKTDVIKHTCKACGDDSAFCCATKAGSAPTKGMEKK